MEPFLTMKIRTTTGSLVHVGSLADGVFVRRAGAVLDGMADARATHAVEGIDVSTPVN